MKNIVMLVLIIAFLSLNLSWAQENNDQVKITQDQEWVIVLDDPRPKRLRGWQRTGYQGSGNYKSAVELKRFGSRLAQDYNLALKDQWLIESLGVYCIIVTFNGDESKTIEALEKRKGVQWVQASNDFKLLSADSSTSGDTQFQQSPDTLPITANGDGVTIAIIDSAVDSTHPDLATAISISGDFVVSGTTFVNGEAHGTAIAGVMIAQPESKLGLSGVAPKAKLFAYRGCWENADGRTNCNTLSLARALDAVVRSGADILNLSLSGPKDFLLDQLVNRVLEGGTLIVAAFDPARAGKPRFPSQQKGVLIVRAESLDRQYGHIFTAPGARVVASPGNSYQFMKGHSIATAYTSGLLALRKQSQGVNLKSGVGWRELSNINKATDLIRQIIGESSQSGRALPTSQFLLVSD